MVALEKINDCEVKPQKGLQVDHGQDICKGSELFDIRFSNIFMLARRKMGKTITLSYVVRKSTTKNTTVIIFSSTANKDATMIALIRWLEARGYPVVVYDSIFNDFRENRIEMLSDFFKNDFIDEDDEGSESDDYIVVFDDLSDMLKNRHVTALAKKARHFRCKIIYSSQYLFDLDKGCRQQIDYILLWGAIPDEKIVTVFKELDIGVPLEQFLEYYKLATSKKYGFLYCNVRSNEFRVGFNQKII